MAKKPTLQRTGNVMRTATGRDFWPLDPRADEVCIEDIAIALARVCRFGGHCKVFYSVAEHSMFVAQIVERTHPAIALHALLHDAAEAYIGDAIRPMKSALRVLRNGIDEPIQKTEYRILEQVHAAFGLRHLEIDEIAAIADADLLALATEARDLMGDPKWPGLPSPDGHHVITWPWLEAHRMFMALFERLRESTTTGGA